MQKLPEINHSLSWTMLTTTGEVVHIRPVHESDVDGLQRYFRGLSASSRYRRFMGAVNELSPADIARYLSKGPAATFAIIAEVTSDDGQSIVGEANCAVDLDRRRGELAVSVKDR